jgi:hypothetical protein
MTAVLLMLALLSNNPGGACPGWLGLGFRYQPPAHGHADGWIYVQRLAPAGPAERGGLLAGDVIISIDGYPICYVDELSSPAPESYQRRNRRSPEHSPRRSDEIGEYHRVHRFEGAMCRLAQELRDGAWVIALSRRQIAVARKRR